LLVVGGTGMKRSKRLIVGLIKIFVYYLITLILVSFLLFVVVRFSTGDVTRIILGEDWTEASAAELRENLGLNRPLYIQYLDYVWQLLHGDLGRSWITHGPVLDRIFRALPFSLTLAAGSILIVVGIGVPLGILAAVKRGAFIDWITRIFSITVSSTPVFWLGLVLIWIFAVTLKIFPVGGIQSPIHFVLPSITLASYFFGATVRMTRGYMLDVLNKEYVTAARAKGLGERKVILGHALRNALLNVLTIVGMFLARMVGSTVITEVVFSFPGLGSTAVHALLNRDGPVAMGMLLTIVVLYITMNSLVEALYKVADPRLR
jgi:peptide/nickel transport system permease protein